MVISCKGILVASWGMLLRNKLSIVYQIDQRFTDCAYLEMMGKDESMRFLNLRQIYHTNTNYILHRSKFPAVLKVQRSLCAVLFFMYRRMKHSGTAIQLILIISLENFSGLECHYYELLLCPHGQVELYVSLTNGFFLAWLLIPWITYLFESKQVENEQLRKQTVDNENNWTVQLLKQGKLQLLNSSVSVCL